MMVVLLVLAGLAEGVGLLGLLPLLELAMEAEAPSGLAQAVQGGLLRIGVAPTLGMLLALIFFAMLAKGVFLWLAMREVGYTVAEVSADLRRRLVRALMEARYGFFREHPAGHIINAGSTEARRAAWAYKDACSAFADGIQGLIYVVVVVLVSWEVALLAPLVAAGLWLALFGLMGMSRRAGNARTAVMKRFVGRLAALLPNIKPVKAMGREEQLVGLVEDDIDAYKRAERTAVLAVETMVSFREPIIVLLMVSGLFWALQSGALAFSAVLALAILFYRLLMIVGRLQTNYQAVIHGESAFWSLHDQILAAEAAREPMHTAGHRQAPPPLAESLAFEHVAFAYEPDRPVLHDVSFEVPAGQMAVLVGPSGAGKTTLMDLVTGLAEPTRGTVRIDGVSLADVDLRLWRRQIGYVPQELLLFHGTVSYNVTLGDDALTRADAERALREAGAWAFVSEHPDGLDRVIGERGSKVSGGQGQRLMLARALVHRPRLLILDEATTGLDPAMERSICRTLLELRGGLTIVAVSHQRALQEVADLVLEVASGGVEPVSYRTRVQQY